MKIVTNLHLHIPLTEGFNRVLQQRSLEVNPESKSGNQVFCSFLSPEENVKILVRGNHMHATADVEKAKAGAFLEFNSRVPRAPKFCSSYNCLPFTSAQFIDT